ncbi:hypothetical protein P368_15690 [Comamonas thiooxydans]|nr:hypothetical protein P365_17615 [Comamonas thiooxydans]KGH10728.1 hypothetical protein P368_15690 [Comamonas thiooxydans]
MVTGFGLKVRVQLSQSIGVWQVAPHFASDAHEPWRATMECKSLIYKKMAFAGLQ